MKFSSLKEKLLNINSFLSLKFNKTDRENTDLALVKTIGVIFHKNNGDEKSLIDKYKKILEKYNISPKVYLLCTEFAKNSTFTDFNDNLIFFSSSDISILGIIKNKKIENFINTKFDYIINLNEIITPLDRLILSKSKAKCRVGFYHSINIDLYDFMLKLKDSHCISNASALESIFYHLKIIS